MWLLAPPVDYKRRRSEVFGQNFLWKHSENPFYVMDNHLAAAWCWLNECDKSASYNFMHIDQHEDLLNNLSIKDYIALKEKSFSFDEYIKLTKTSRSVRFQPQPVFRWDNYIIPIMRLFPNWFEESFFATLEESSSLEKRAIGFRPSWHQNQLTLASYIETAFENSWNELEELAEKKQYKWIVNFDLDYFFKDRKQMLTDDYILEICERLHVFIDRIQVFTLALSPECCGGWTAAEHALEVFCQGFPEFLEFNREKKSL